jgi:hypothetical protein
MTLCVPRGRAFVICNGRISMANMVKQLDIRLPTEIRHTADGDTAGMMESYHALKRMPNVPKAS